MDTISTTSPDIVILLGAKLPQWNNLIHRLMTSGFLVVTAETLYDALYQLHTLHTESPVQSLQRQYAGVNGTPASHSPCATPSIHTSLLSAPVVDAERIDPFQSKTEVLVPRFMIWDETTFIQVNAHQTSIPCSPIPSLFATIPHLVISQHPERLNLESLLDLDLDFYPESAPLDCLIEKIKFRIKRDRHIQKPSQSSSPQQFKENYIKDSQSILEAFPDLILRINKKGEYLDFIVGTDFKSLQPIDPERNRKILKIMPSEFCHTIKTYIQRAFKTKKTQIYEYAVRRNKQKQIQEARVICMNPNEVLIIIRDITKQKRKEIILQEAKDKAERLSHSKSAFIAQMTHELRTPLNSILGFADILQQDPLLPTHVQEQLGIIHHSAEHLLAVINEILDISKLEAGKCTVHHDEFNLHTLLHYLKEMFSLKAKEKGIDLVFQKITALPQFVRGDEQKLRQILINLLGNALKFTKQGSITLSTQVITSPECPTHPLITFTLQDTGPGIAPEELGSIFEPFIQSHTGRTLRQGTGLGLSISQKLARLMGGDITVESHTVPPHQGTVFSVTLPFENSSTPPVHDFTAIAPSPVASSPLTQGNLTEDNLLTTIPPSPEELDSTLLLSLTQSWLQELELAASQANSSHLEKMIDTLTPQQQPLANLLTYWLHNFRFDHILHWIKHTQA